MNLKKITTALLFITLLGLLPDEVICQEVMLLRSGSTLKQNEILLWESVFFTPMTEKYDFESDQFSILGGENHKLTAYTMLGYGVLDNLELLFQLPVNWNVATKEGQTDSSTGIGDISMQTKLMLADGKGLGPAFNVGAMLRFPTGKATANPPLGDGTLDLGFSAVVTKKMRFFAAHFKVGYIFNGIDSAGIDLGDKFLYMLKGDFTVVKGDYRAMKELTLMLGLCGDMKPDDVDADGAAIESSRQYRPLKIAPMIRWTPAKGLFIRPRVIIPIEPLARGGKIFAAQYVLDVKYSF